MYLISAPIFMLFTMGAGFSQTFGSFLVCRLFAGLTGSPALAVGKSCWDSLLKSIDLI